jgi:hypothetical protein
MAEIDSEGELDRSEIADFLREFADELDADRRTRTPKRDDDVTVVGEETDDETTRERADADATGTADEPVDPETMTIIVGGDSATLTLPERMEFDIEVASRSPLFASGVRQGIEIDLEWEVEESPEDDSIEVI